MSTLKSELPDNVAGGSSYDKQSPFFAKIKGRYRLNSSSSQKETYHVVVDLKGSRIRYSVGDCLGILPRNSPEIVSYILDALKASGEEIISDQRRKDSLPFRTFLSERANLARVPKKLAPQGELDAYEIWDFLQKNPVSISPQTFCDLLAPLLPRFYSIASSQNAVAEEAHLTIVLTQYEKNEILRQGTCSYFLCKLAPLEEAVVPIFLHGARDFVLPEEAKTKPIIMVGPGAGVAPFRGFMQERLHQKASGKNWLFFGERNREHDFYYREYWEELTALGKLRLDLAFSRDQQHKVYVQDKMLENAKDLWDWIEEGAYFYVCGDATRMAKDVEATLIAIIQKHSCQDMQEAKQYLKRLRNEGRYLRDVY